jgi:hypothetical protein
MNQFSPESDGVSNADASSNGEERSPLDSVLEATLSQGRRTIKPEEWDRLRQVLVEAQDKGEPMDRWSCSLVRALLEMRLPDAVLKTKSLEHMSQMIASTLCSDPTSKQKLMELHTQLMEDRP